MIYIVSSKTTNQSFFFRTCFPKPTCLVQVQTLTPEIGCLQPWNSFKRYLKSYRYCGKILTFPRNGIVDKLKLLHLPTGAPGSGIESRSERSGAVSDGSYHMKHFWHWNWLMKSHWKLKLLRMQMEVRRQLAVYVWVRSNPSLMHPATHPHNNGWIRFSQTVIADGLWLLSIQQGLSSNSRLPCHQHSCTNMVWFKRRKPFLKVPQLSNYSWTCMNHHK